MSARFKVGDRVRIDDRDPLVHHRVPRYARGHVGVVERLCGAFGQPELLVYGDENQADAEETAENFLATKQDVWTEWVPAEVAEKVLAAIG